MMPLLNIDKNNLKKHQGDIFCAKIFFNRILSLTLQKSFRKT